MPSASVAASISFRLHRSNGGVSEINHIYIYIYQLATMRNEEGKDETG